MSWISQNKRALRVILLAVALVSFAGPWGYDQINVPAQFECTPPFIRLQGDFCGMPISGLGVIGLMADTLRGLPAAWLRGDPGLSGGWREILLAASPLLLILPLVTTLGRITREQSRWWGAINPVAWSVGLLITGFVALAGFASGWGPGRAWGIWLYVVAAAAMIAGEVWPARVAERSNLPAG